MKHGHKKRKKLYNIKTSDDKTVRNLNEGKFGLNPFLRKRKQIQSKKGNQE